jgi:hypothetical protein
MKIKKSRYGDYEHVVKFDVWSGYQVHVVFTDDLGKSRKARYGSAGGTDGARALHSSAQDGHGHLFFRIGDTPAGCIAHEAWHAVRCMMVDFGGMTIMENEATAYHLGHLVQKITDYKWQLIAAKVGVKSSTKKKATHGKDSQRAVAGLQGLPTHGRGTGTQEAREEGTSVAFPQADGCGNAGDSSEATGIVRTGRA